MQDWSNSIANALELLQSCTKLSKLYLIVDGPLGETGVHYAAAFLSQYKSNGKRVGHWVAAIFCKATVWHVCYFVTIMLLLVGWQQNEIYVGL